MSDGQYEALAARFDHTFRDTRGGATFDYLTGEQVTSRLNEVLGPYGWSFRVLEHGIHAEADECWVQGELTATFVVPDLNGEGFRERTVTRQQFGSQKVKRSRSSGTPLDIGFDLKGAATDAMKKCASLIGVGLYLSEKQAPGNQGRPAANEPEPTPLKTKVELVADLKKGIEYARSLGLDPAEPDAAKLNRGQIEDMLADLRKQCSDVLRSKKAETA